MLPDKSVLLGRLCVLSRVIN